MPEVTIHSNGSERKAVVVVNGVKKEFACDKAIDISDEYVEALKNSRFDVTEHDSAEGSAEAGEVAKASPAQQSDIQGHTPTPPPAAKDEQPKPVTTKRPPSPRKTKAKA